MNGKTPAGDQATQKTPSFCGGACGFSADAEHASVCVCACLLTSAERVFLSVASLECDKVEFSIIAALRP